MYIQYYVTLFRYRSHGNNNHLHVFQYKAEIRGPNHLACFLVGMLVIINTHNKMPHEVIKYVDHVTTICINIGMNKAPYVLKAL